METPEGPEEFGEAEHNLPALAQANRAQSSCGTAARQRQVRDMTREHRKKMAEEAAKEAESKEAEKESEEAEKK